MIVKLIKLYNIIWPGVCNNRREYAIAFLLFKILYTALHPE